MNRLELIAPCIFGLEAVLGRELKQLGYTDQFVENGRITYAGDAMAVCRSNLWLRTAERVLLKTGQFHADTFEELFEGTKVVSWHKWIPEDGEFPVEVNSVNSKLASIPDCQSIIKKAVVESLKKKYRRQWFDESGQQYKITAMILKDWVTLGIDTTGTGLHKRGYRILNAPAPLKETLASALLMLSRWNRERVLVDPFCGSGTIPVEAALIAKNIAPGINRSFASEKWPEIGTLLWERARSEASDSILKNTALRIRGSDIDENAISMARYHASRAGVEEDIHLQTMPVSGLSSRYKYGFIICNPPYGERIGELREVEELYRNMGQIFNSLDTWSCYILSSHKGFERLFGRKADKKRKLYNGKIVCNYYQFFGPIPPKNSMKSKGH